MVTTDDGLIAAIEFQEHGEKQWLCAGFVDLQVNGYAGHDLNGLTLEVATVRALCQALLKVGVTSFLPTIITAPTSAMARLKAAITTVSKAQRSSQANMTLRIHGEAPSDCNCSPWLRSASCTTWRVKAMATGNTNTVCASTMA